jgi:hypothetical protein
MTTTYNSAGYAAKNPVISQGLARNVLSYHDTVTTTASLGLNDGGTLLSLPPNAVILDGWVNFATAMDTNVSPTLTIDLGVTGAAAQFLSADTTARAGGIQKTLATTAYGYKNTSGADLAVTWKAHAAAATGAAGTIEVSLRYVIEN